MKRHLLIILALFSLTSIRATEIDFKEGSIIQSGGARSSTLSPAIIADFSNGIITTMIDDYEGQVYLYISNSGGVTVTIDTFYTMNHYIHTTTVTDLASGTYYVHYIIGNFHFYGMIMI